MVKQKQEEEFYKIESRQWDDESSLWEATEILYGDVHTGEGMYGIKTGQIESFSKVYCLVNSIKLLCFNNE